MKEFNNKKGFTLIEIIVVLLIVGVLAAISLRILITNVQKSQATQALLTMDTYKAALESCFSINSGVTPSPRDDHPPCSLASLNLSSSGDSWSYGIGYGDNYQPQTAQLGAGVDAQGNYASGNLMYSLVAIDTGNNSITLTRATDGTFTCSTGNNNPYTGLC